MKKMLTTLILAMVLVCAAALAESDYTYYPESEEYVGFWANEDAVLSIEHTEADYNLFYCVVSRTVNDDVTEVWEYDGCAYDDIGKGMSCEQIGKKTVYTVDGDEVKQEVVFEDGAALFTLNENGQMEFSQFTDEPVMVFTRVDESDIFAPEMAYEGTWVSDRISLVIESLDDVIYADVYWAGSAFDTAHWEYVVTYDEVADELNCPETGVKTILTYDENGDVVSSQQEFSDGAASFRLTEDGTLIWTDYKQTPGENQYEFERAETPVPVPQAQDFADFYFRVIAGVEKGTAGSSLKLAQAAAQVTGFSSQFEMWDLDAQAFRANMLEGWESLTDEERAAFDDNFLDVVGMIDSALNDWDSAKGAFEDAGVAEDMEMVVFDPLYRLAWENLCGHTLTMGNDDADYEEEEEDGLYAARQPIQDSPEWVKNLPQAQDENTSQLFVVAGLGMDKTTATVSMHERNEEGDWIQILSTPGFVGKNGLCLDQDHAEGCGQTPIGTYHFNAAFGIAPDPGCAMEYTQVDDSYYWSGDEKQRYNEMVTIDEYPDLDMTNSEHIVEYDFQYQYCLNISFNEDGTPGRGSAIFLHCLGPVKPYTGGCVAIPEYIMKQVMQCATEDCVVVIDTLDNLGGSF